MAALYPIQSQPPQSSHFRSDTRVRHVSTYSSYSVGAASTAGSSLSGDLDHSVSEVGSNRHLLQRHRTLSESHPQLNSPQRPSEEQPAAQIPQTTPSRTPWESRVILEAEPLTQGTNRWEGDMAVRKKIRRWFIAKNILEGILGTCLSRAKVHLIK